MRGGMLTRFRRRIRRSRDVLAARRQPRREAKVFCLGWLKTGTTSFGHAMRRLGYSHCGYDPGLLTWFRVGKVDRLVRHARHFDSFDDLPWNRMKLLPTIDAAFPGSRFVLLEREPEAWLASLLRYSKSLGTEVADPETALRTLDDHNAQVRDFFARREDEFLVMRVTDGEGYEKLCPFLGLPVVEEPFPHVNRSRK